MVPHLVNQHDHKSLHTLSVATSLSEEDLVQECLPNIMISILTSYAHRQNQQQYKDATDTLDFIHSILSKETLDHTMKHSLSQFVVALLSKLYDTPQSDSPISKYSR